MSLDAIYKAQEISDGDLSTDDTYECGCGESHTVNDVTCVVTFKHRPWHIDCLIDTLSFGLLDIERHLKHFNEDHEAQATRSANGIWWCSHRDCDHYSKLQDGNDYCVKGASRTPLAAKGSLCLPWLLELMNLINTLSQNTKPERTENA